MVNSVLMRVPAEWEKIIRKQAEERKKTMMEMQRRVLGQLQPQIQDLFGPIDDPFKKNKENR